MIPFIRSLSELMAITESRNATEEGVERKAKYSFSIDSGQKEILMRSIDKKELYLPKLSRSKRRKWFYSKKDISNFLHGLDYNNQIQSSYDLILIEKQANRIHQNAA
tara:strand:+ start:1161 stop:1481 length:321 start_codon:yes stop_codon:yes gene_type:complete